MCDKKTPGPQRSIQTVMCYQFNPETDIIGKGAYGEVYKATLVKPPGNNGTKTDMREKVAALKRSLCGSKEEGIPASTMREVMVLKEISKTMQNAGETGSCDMFGSENVVKLYDVFMDTNTVYIASEYCEAGDLSRYLKKLPMHRLSDGQQYRQWMRDLLSGLCFLHRKDFSHRDLKPQNLVLKAIPSNGKVPADLLDGKETEESTDKPQYRLKITDFGLSRVEGIPVKKYQHEAVTLWYRSPDVLLGNTNYGCTADLWSAGCVIGEVATGSALFRGRDSADQLKCIFTRLGAPTELNFPSLKQYALYKKIFDNANRHWISKDTRDSISLTLPFDLFEDSKRNLQYYFKKHGAMDIVGQDGVDLIAHLLAYEPRYRITAQEALQHSFFSSLLRGMSSLPKPDSQAMIFTATTVKEYDPNVFSRSAKTLKLNQTHPQNDLKSRQGLVTQIKDIAEEAKDGGCVVKIKSNMSSLSIDNHSESYTVEEGNKAQNKIGVPLAFEETTKMTKSKKKKKGRRPKS